MCMCVCVHVHISASGLSGCGDQRNQTPRAGVISCCDLPYLCA